MTQNTRFALELQLDRTEDGPACHVRQSPAGQGDCRFVNPFSPKDLQRFWTVIEEIQKDGQATATQRALVQDAGRRLFDAAFAGEVLGCLRASFDQAHFDQHTLRMLVDLSTTPELEKLPWEFMYNPERSEFLALTQQAPLARYTGLQHRVLPVNAPPPLRALVVVAGPSSYPRVDVDREWIGLLDAVDFLGKERRMIIERLQKPTLLDLQRKLRQGEYHILHFIGHGVFDKHTNEGQLVFEDEMGRSRLVSGQHLGALMRDHTSLRYFCLTGPTRTGVSIEYRALLDVGRSLIRRGVAAVVAPQMRVSARAWTAFCQTVYRQLAVFQPVDLAVVQGRLAMAEAVPDVGWAAPVLFSRCADGLLFDDGRTPKPAVTDDTLQAGMTASLNSLRIRTASHELMARWGTDLSEPPKGGKR